MLLSLIIGPLLVIWFVTKSLIVGNIMNSKFFERRYSNIASSSLGALVILFFTCSALLPWTILHTSSVLSIGALIIINLALTGYISLNWSHFQMRWKEVYLFAIFVLFVLVATFFSRWLFGYARINSSDEISSWIARNANTSRIDTTTLSTTHAYPKTFFSQTWYSLLAAIIGLTQINVLFFSYWVVSMAIIFIAMGSILFVLEIIRVRLKYYYRLIISLSIYFFIHYLFVTPYLESDGLLIQIWIIFIIIGSIIAYTQTTNRSYLMICFYTGFLMWYLSASSIYVYSFEIIVSFIVLLFLNHRIVFKFIQITSIPIFAMVFLYLMSKTNSFLLHFLLLIFVAIGITIMYIPSKHYFAIEIELGERLRRFRYLLIVVILFVLFIIGISGIGDFGDIKSYIQLKANRGLILEGIDTQATIVASWVLYSIAIALSIVILFFEKRPQIRFLALNILIFVGLFYNPLTEFGIARMIGASSFEPIRKLFYIPLALLGLFYISKIKFKKSFVLGLACAPISIVTLNGISQSSYIVNTNLFNGLGFKFNEASDYIVDHNLDISGDISGFILNNKIRINYSYNDELNGGRISNATGENVNFKTISCLVKLKSNVDLKDFTYKDFGFKDLVTIGSYYLFIK